MLNSFEIANLCASLYSEPSKFDQVLEVEKVCIGIKHYEDCIAVIGRGSYTMLDWIRDLEAVALISTPDIGLVPIGFNVGLPAVFDAVAPIIAGRPAVFGGHSLGAAHIAQLAGKFTAAGAHIAQLSLFGCPTPGGEKLRYLLSGTKIESYKNASDPVTVVPVLPCLVPVRDFLPLNEPHPASDPWGLFADHHIQHYVVGTHKIFGGLTNADKAGR